VEPDTLAAPFVGQGATVIVVDLDVARIAPVAEPLGDNGLGMVCDLREPDASASRIHLKAGWLDGPNPGNIAVDTYQWANGSRCEREG